MTDAGSPGETVVVLNPTSGSGDHAEEIRERAELAGYELRETESGGDAIAFAADAADGGASTIVAAGGDGTINEVVRGVDRADALDRVTVGVVPAGTGNNFAGNLGITGIGHAFDLLADGERRRIDLGVADGRTFVNSCVGGLTADASAATSSDQKSQLGVLAYALNTLESVRSFDGLGLSVDVPGDDERRGWSGTAILVLIGNARRFPPSGRTQADAEDGLLEVDIVEEAPTVDLVGERLAERLFGESSEHIRRLRAPALDLSVEGEEPITFSLDGELAEHRELSVGVRPGALEVPVGDAYEPDPD